MRTLLQVAQDLENAEYDLSSATGVKARAECTLHAAEGAIVNARERIREHRGALRALLDAAEYE